MTSREWMAKRLAALREYRAELQARTTVLDFEAWRVAKGYIVDPQSGVRPQ